MKDNNPNMLDDLIKDITLAGKAFKKIAGESRNDIIKRTLQGIDVNSVGFRGYSDDYADFREEHGRLIDHATLSFYGNMLKGMKVKEISKGAKIYFPDEAERLKAGWHNNTGAGKGKVIREFFGLTGFEADKAFKKYKGLVIK